MTVKKINKAIGHLGLEIVKGHGYVYFLDFDGNQVGDSFMICYLNSLSIERWISHATTLLLNKTNQ
jgi:hypothetical protein